MMLGPTGVGKSALINRLLGQNVAPESAFGEPDGTKVREYTGEFKGVGLKLIDTPGLELSSTATAYNRSVLKKVWPWSLNASFILSGGRQPKEWDNITVYLLATPVLRVPWRPLFQS